MNKKGSPPILEGVDPVNLLEEKSSSKRERIPLITVGIVPISKFDSSLSFSRDVSWSMTEGSELLKQLRESRSSFSLTS